MIYLDYLSDSAVSGKKFFSNYAASVFAIQNCLKETPFFSEESDTHASKT